MKRDERNAHHADAISRISHAEAQHEAPALEDATRALVQAELNLARAMRRGHVSDARRILHDEAAPARHAFRHAILRQADAEHDAPPTPRRARP